MKRILTLGILVFIATLQLNCQNRISLQIEASPNYSFKTFKNNSPANFTSSDESKIGYSVSVKSSFRLFKEFYAISGLEYNNKGYKTKAGYFDEEYNLIITPGIIDLIFLEIPLYFKYKIKLDELFNLSPVVGLSYGRLIGLKVLYDDNKKSATLEEIKDSQFNRDAINLHCGLELGIKIFGKFSGKIEPKVDYTITELNEGKDNQIIEHLYIVGVNIGLILEL